MSLLKDTKQPPLHTQGVQKVNRDAKLVNSATALSRETEISGGRVPERTHRSLDNDSPRQYEENGIIWKCIQELGHLAYERKLMAPTTGSHLSYEDIWISWI